MGMVGQPEDACTDPWVVHHPREVLRHHHMGPAIALLTALAR
jgi:hypothetical protein